VKGRSVVVARRFPHSPITVEFDEDEDLDRLVEAARLVVEARPGHALVEAISALSEALVPYGD